VLCVVCVNGQVYAASEHYNISHAQAMSSSGAETEESRNTQIEKESEEYDLEIARSVHLQEARIATVKERGNSEMFIIVHIHFN